MCYSAENSIQAFALNAITSTLLFLYAENPELKVIALTLLFVGFMQLFDWTFWTYPPPSLENRIATKLAILFNHLQPVVFALLIWMYLYRPRALPKESQLAILLYVAIAIVYTVYVWKKVEYTEKNPNGAGLLWKWNIYRNGGYLMYGLYFVVFLLLILQNLTGYRRLVFFVLFIGTAIFSVLKYWIRYDAGRMWCYLINEAPSIFILVEFLRRNGILRLSK
jgi:hypothetical protein